MEEWLQILRFIGLAQLLSLLGVIGKAQHTAKHLQAAALFLLCCIGYFLIDWDGIANPSLLFFVLLAFPHALPIAFWLFSLSLFRDKFRLQAWHGWLLLANLVIRYLLVIIRLNFESELPEVVITILLLFSHALSLIFVILAITEALRGRATDLVLPRLRFRAIFILITAALIVLTVLSEAAFLNEAPPVVLDLLQKVIIVVFNFYFTIRLLHFKSGFFPEPMITPVVPTTTTDRPLINKLMHAIEVDKAYLTEGLTIPQLATQLNVKEYKLRQAINQHLGFRNFNDFLNQYRIEAAKTILSDSGKKELTVLEIAYSLGYQSLSPFNKAFKDATNMTPTAFRRKNADGFQNQ